MVRSVYWLLNYASKTLETWAVHHVIHNMFAGCCSYTFIIVRNREKLLHRLPQLGLDGSMLSSFTFRAEYTSAVARFHALTWGRSRSRSSKDGACQRQAMHARSSQHIQDQHHGVWICAECLQHRPSESAVITKHLISGEIVTSDHHLTSRGPPPAPSTFLMQDNMHRSSNVDLSSDHLIFQCRGCCRLVQPAAPPAAQLRLALQRHAASDPQAAARWVISQRHT